MNTTRRARAPSEDLLLYDSRDLTTHAVCVGMTGSGKTGLCLALLEEAGIDGIPAICIDPKGDLGNLLLTFPHLEAAEFLSWVDSGEAQRKGLSVEQYAAQTAENWKNGLAQWGQTPERIGKLRDAVDLAIYTPGSEAGLPLSVVRSFAAPPAELLQDTAALRERIATVVSGLLALLDRDANPINSRDHVLLSTLFEDAWRKGTGLDMASLIAAVQKPPLDKVGAFDLETFYPAKERLQLAMAINNLLASPGFAAWLNGEPLDIQRLLFTAAGKPRIAVISIAHLSDAERMFIVTLLLNEVIAWMRSQSGTSSLRAILYMDEIFGYFPPTANPPSKQPMLTLLKQGRAFGLGCVLATQNPVDLDYKGLGECRHLDDRPAADGARQAARARRTGKRRARLGPRRARSHDLRPDAARVPDAQRPRRCARAVSKSLGAVVSARSADRRGDFQAHGAASERDGGALHHSCARHRG